MGRSLLAWLPVAALCFTVVGCGSSTPSKPNGDEIAKTLQPSVQRELNRKKITVTSVKCAAPTDRAAKCIARVATVADLDDFGTPKRTEPLPINVVVDPKTGKPVSWKAVPTPEFTADGGPPGTEGSMPEYAWTLVSCQKFKQAGQRWFKQAARIEGDYAASQSPNLTRSVARAAWLRTLIAACAKAKNKTYRPVAPAEQTVTDYLASKGY